MHVVLNAQLLSDQAGYRSAGMSNYTRSLLAALGPLAAGDPAWRLTALTHTPGFDVAGVAAHVTHRLLERPAARIAWEQIVLPQLLRQLNADLVHGLVNVLPLATSVPGVVTVHDLSFLHFRHLFPATKRLYLSALCRASVRKAAAVIAVSRQTAGDVVRCFGAAPDKVAVAYNGVDERFTPADAAHSAAFRAAKGLPERYFLFLSTLEPRKNLETLLHAYARWRDQAAPTDRDIRLVIAGGKGWFYDAVFAQTAALGLQDAVTFPGYVPDEELPDWYRSALGFVLPSVFEGFGLPVLEALACGAPVLCSDIPSLREVAGEAALLAPPREVDAWTAGLALLASQPELRADLRRRGPDQAARFTWRAAAHTSLDVYRRTLA